MTTVHRSRACIVVHVLALFGVLQAFPADAQDVPDWVHESNDHARVLLDVMARFAPEDAGRFGVDGLDEEVRDLSPGFNERHVDALGQAHAELEAPLARAEEGAVRLDLQLLVQNAEDEIAGIRLNETHLLPYVVRAGADVPDDWFAWIEAGGILAVANVRGGGEYGEAWHQAGTLANKQNTYDDFIAAAEALVREGYTSPEHLAINGASNGGMLVGAVMAQRPELFAVALPQVGVLDALRFPSFTAGPRWATDMGDPSIAEQFEWLYAWSPLHNLRDGTCYPATLVTTALNECAVMRSARAPASL